MLDYTLDDGVAVVSMDDGRANALSFEMIEGISNALDRASQEAGAVLLKGRAGVFSAGFDLKVMKRGGAGMVKLVRAGADLLVKLYIHPQPLVIACTGHAVAGGALAVLTGDYRVGADGEFKIGLNEVEIGMALPSFVTDLVGARISKRHLTKSMLLAHLYDPDEALDAGFIDQLCPADEVVEHAMMHARKAAKLDSAAYAETKRRLRAEFAQGMVASMDAQLL